MAPRRRFDFRFKETVLQYAETHSSEKTARHFNIDTKRIRYWRNQRGALLLADRSRARLTGGGRKKVSLELEGRLSDWIYSMRDKQNRVSRSMIKRKALEIYPSVQDGGQLFVASTGWLQRFLQRNDLSLRRRSPAAQPDPDLLTEKLVSFVDHVGKAVSSQGVLVRDIIAMDETTVWFDSPTTTDAAALSPAGHQDRHLTVVLSARADGTKLQPYIVFRGGAKTRPPQASGAVTSTSVNGWMNDALTADWLQAVLGKASSAPRLLVWDSYRCHVGAATKAELTRGYNITTAEIPSGCTRFIQAPDVMWNQPFKQSLQDAYHRWAAGGGGKRHSAGGAFRGPGRRLLVDWVVAAWDKLDTDMIRRSFKACGLSVNSSGSEDHLILCFREGQPCAAGRDALTRARRQSQENWCQPAQEDEEDEEELFNNELVVLDVDDEEEEEDRDHSFIHKALPANDKKVIIKEEQQQWSPSLDQEDPPEPPHIKEEQEELWTRQEEADVPVKSEEEEEEEAQSSQLHQSQTEQMETGGPEPARNPDPDTHLGPETEDSSDPETEDSDDWTGTGALRSGSECHNSNVTPAGGEQLLLHSCSDCGKRFGNKTSLKVHMRIHTGENSFSCLVCGEIFTQGANLRQHMGVHTGGGGGGEQLSCSVCEDSPDIDKSSVSVLTAPPEPARNPDPDTQLEPETVMRTGPRPENLSQD